MRREAIAALALAAALAAPARALREETIVETRVAGGPPATRIVTAGQALILLSSGTAPAALDGALAALGADRGADLGRGWVVVNWNTGLPVSRELGLLAALPGVAAARPSHVYKPLRAPNDPLFAQQYALSQVNAPAAWEYETGFSSRVTIAVVDAGVDGGHPDLAAKFANTTSVQYDPNTGNPVAGGDPLTPACDHATHVAGVAAAVTENGTGVAGLSWGAQLVSYKVFSDASCNMDCSNKGAALCDTNDPAIISALNEAVARQNTAAYGRIVVNLSLGGPGACSNTLADPLQGTITNAITNGVVVVAAAGNDGSAVNDPGNCAGVIPMGATDNTNNVASFSSRGPELASGGLVAPGVSVLTTDVSSRTVGATGTSFSSPMGAGLAALLISANPLLTPAQVQTYMRAGAEDIGQSPSVQGAGRMNAYRSLRLAVKGTLAGFDGEQKPTAFPNPFRVSQNGSVSFAVPPSLQGAAPSIKIYALDGQFVREIQGLTWDGTNTAGKPVASGTYVFVVKTAKGTGRGRVAVLR